MLMQTTTVTEMRTMVSLLRLKLSRRMQVCLTFRLNRGGSQHQLGMCAFHSPPFQFLPML